MLRSVPVSQRFQSKDLSISQHQHNNHKCYFHNTNNITKFCINKKCTLPLCEKCIPIHLKQHSKQQKTLGKQNIILYSDAHRIAIQQLSTTLNKKQENINRFQLTVKNVRTQIDQIIDRYFAQFDKKILDHANQIKILSEKQTKIKKGSLKTLIFYFADEEGFKIKSQSNRNQKFNLSEEINKLIQKLNKQVKKFQGISDKPENIMVSYRQNQRSISQLRDFQSVKKNEQLSIKFETSSDFAQVLKDQRNRLQNVRNKNLMFATNYDSVKQDDNFKKYGSKSVDNFYSNKVHKENQQSKEQKQNRPLQFGFKTSSQGFSIKKQTVQDYLNSQQKIDKIRKKYIGDQSLSKEKRQFTEQIRRQPLGIIKLNDQRSQKQINLSDRLLSREQIRLDIENRLQQKVVIKPTIQIKKQYVPISQNFKQENHQTFRKPPQSFEEKIQVIKQQEFTLNKNNGFNDTQKLVLQKEKILMSSIKKELKAVPTDESKPKQTKFKSFFQGNNRQRLSSFDVRQEKNNQINVIQNRQQINDFVINPSEGLKQENLFQKQFSKKKDQLYEETRQRIRLSEPTLNKAIDQVSNKNQQKRQMGKINYKSQSTEKTLKEGRRFNYLYDSSNINQTLNRAC